MRKYSNRKTTLAMMFKLSEQVEKGWRKLRGFKEISLELEGKPYLNDREWKMLSPDGFLNDTYDFAYSATFDNNSSCFSFCLEVLY